MSVDSVFMDASVPRPGKRAKCKHGSLLDLASRRELPAGPSSLQEMFSFASEILKTCFRDAECEKRFRALLQHGVVESSDYSGVFAERQAKAMLFQTLEEDYGCRVQHTVTRMCDIDRNCQQVLAHASENLDSGSSCVFFDIRELVLREAQDCLHRMVPGRDEPPADRKLKYDEMRRWLFQNGNLAVRQDSVFLRCSAGTSEV